MIKKFALRETLDSSEACELISAMISSDFAPKDLLAYCIEGQIDAYIRVSAKQVHSLEPEMYAPGQATHDFIASGLHRVVTTDLLDKPTPCPMVFSGEARPVIEPGDAELPRFWIDWTEECRLTMEDLWFYKARLEDFAQELVSKKQQKFDSRQEKGIGQTILAVAALASKGNLDLHGDAPYAEAVKLAEMGEIEFDVHRNTFRKYFSYATNLVKEEKHAGPKRGR